MTIVFLGNNFTALSSTQSELQDTQIKSKHDTNKALKESLIPHEVSFTLCSSHNIDT